MKKRLPALAISLSMLTATSSSLYVNDMDASALTSYTVMVTMGTAETTVYGVPTAFQNRFDRISTRIYGIFRAAFGVEMDMVMPEYNYIKKSPADECTGSMGVYDMPCLHVPASQCRNDGEYHHTNCAVNCIAIYQDPPWATTDYIEMFITASYLCAVDNGTHIDVTGVCATYDQVSKIVVRDNDYALEDDVGLGNYENNVWVSSSIVHELGHVFGADDHYYTKYGDDRDNCLWGYNHNESIVVENNLMCQSCYNTVKANIS